MGPQATVDFMAKLVSRTNAARDQDHIRLIVDHNPTVPNRHEAIAGDRTEVSAALMDMARGLERAGADFLLMVCNTAHAFQQDIKDAVGIPFVGIVEEVVSELDSKWSDSRRVGVMAADGCLASGLYQRALREAGREPITWSDVELEQFMALLYQVKAGDALEKTRLRMEQLAQSLIVRGAEVLIAGCTEIPLILHNSDATSELPFPLLSSTDILVSRTIDYAMGIKALPVLKE